MPKIVNLAYILTILVFIDLLATLFWVEGGLATEANPIMNFFLGVSPLIFVLIKLGVSFSGIFILHRFRGQFRKFVLHSLMGLNLVYVSVCLYHLWAMLFLLTATN
jgi:hypothetical protein